MSETSDTVADGMVVRIKYVLRTGEGAIVDRSGDEPMPYLHGAGNIVPGLERQLVGKKPGERLLAVVAPEEGYGPRHKVKPMSVPRSAFPKGAKLEKGMGFTMQGPNGRGIPVWIAKVQGTNIVVDPNHPLAGATLHFEVEVVDIRAATAEERAHGHPHGPGGHHDHDHDHDDE